MSNSSAENNAATSRGTAVNPPRRIKLLFVTYSVPARYHTNTTMVGVLKRCIRLIEHLPLHRFEIKLLHFGEIPDGDPLIPEVVRRLHRPWVDHGILTQANSFSSRAYLPDVVILGEGPGSGMMLAASRWATARKIPQVCIENYYGREQVHRFLEDSPWIKRWLLLGLPDKTDFGRISEHAMLVPPLLAPELTDSETGREVTVLGYDPHILPRVNALIERLPRKILLRVVQPKGPCWQRIHTKFDQTAFPFMSPTDSVYRQIIGDSAVVVCKNGFQQMMEALAVGTPVVGVAAPGGVPESWLSGHVRQYIRFLPSHEEDWSRVLAAIGMWLASRPSMPWVEAVRSFANPARHGAQALVELINELLPP